MIANFHAYSAPNDSLQLLLSGHMLAAMIGVRRLEQLDLGCKYSLIILTVLVLNASDVAHVTKNLPQLLHFVNTALFIVLPDPSYVNLVASASNMHQIFMLIIVFISAKKSVL